MDKIKKFLQEHPWLGYFFIVQVFLLFWGGWIQFNFPDVRITPIFPMISIEEIVPGWEGSRLAQLLLGSWYRWDTEWYMRIAVGGFQPIDGRLAFAPVYPILTRMLGDVLGGHYLLASLVISQGALLAAGFLLIEEYKQFTDDETAGQGIRYLLFFPTTIFLFAGYTESLFLMVFLLSWRAARKGVWLQAGVFGGLAVLTRFMGVALLVPYGYLWLRDREKRTLKDLLSILLIPAAFAGWNLFARYYYGRFPSEDLAGFWPQLHTDWPWVGVWNSLVQVFSPQSYRFYHLHIDLIVVLVFSGLIVYAFRHLPAEYGLMMATIFLMGITKITTDGILVSISRYVLPIFPGYMILAEWGKARWFRTGWNLITLPLMVILAAFFFIWGWVG